MKVIELSGIHQAYDERQILNDANFYIKSYEHIGLIGNNGTGKTTLAKIIMNEVEVQTGIVYVDEGVRIGCLKQVNEQTVDADVTHETLSRIGVHGYKEIEDARMAQLSGGERTKYQLASIFDDSYDVIILDEPTNHLDSKGRNWLIKELNRYHGACIVISHDRYFLDETVERIVEVDGLKLHSYNGNYSGFMEQKKHLRYTQELAYTKQQKEKATIQREIKRLKDWSDKGHRESTKQHLKKGAAKIGAKEFARAKVKKKDKQVKSKIKQMEKVVTSGVERPEDVMKIQFEFGQAGHNSRKVLSVEGVSKAFGDRVLFEGAQFYIFKEEKIGLIGANGTGKSTLINLIRGLDMDYEGCIYLNSGQKVAYISQDILDMNVDQSVLEVLDLNTRERQSKGRRILAQIGIGESKVHKKISSLSMGERTRIKIAGLILDEIDFLILDEPTNHLDILTRQTLENALSHFSGTLLLCSHDRYLIENVCEKLLVIENKQIKRIDDTPKKYYNGEVNVTRDNKNQSDKDSEKLVLMLLENKMSAVITALGGYAPGSLPYLEAETEYQKIQKEIRRIKGE